MTLFRNLSRQKLWLLLLFPSFYALFFNPAPVLSFSKGKMMSLKKQKKPQRRPGIVPGVIIVKLKNSSALAKAAGPAGLPSIAEKIAAGGITDIIPLAPQAMRSSSGMLKNIFYFKFPKSEDPQKMATRFAHDPHVEYAEPKRIHYITATPNDDLYFRQTYAGAIAIEAAWDITKGEQGDVVIAIVDGGTDWEHVDLKDNIWANPGEIAGNGIDDDNNGYIDDVRGWNFNNNSNDPTGPAAQPTNQNHGTHTAGIAVARANNGAGVAGMSWNSKLMPVCTAAIGEDGSIGFGFEGILYAVENGADIVNCSWGSAGSPSQFEQDVIDFATMNGTLIVAAAGNENSNNDLIPFYPAQYNHVLSVGGTSDKDDKVTSSNYGLTVDVFAPGLAVYSTMHGNNYGSNTGTSMASPVVAGIAALVKTKNPQMTPAQIEEQIRQSADWVSFTNQNARNTLAKGRINAYKALTATGLKAVRLTNLTFQDSGGNGVINEGETIDLLLEFTSILGPADNVTIKLQTNNLEVQIVENEKTIAAIAKGETVTLPFTFHIANGTADNTSLLFYVHTTADNYADYEIIRFKIRPPVFKNHDNGILQVSITSCGNIGFTGYADENDINGFSFLDNGTGFVFKGRNTLYEAGLLVGVSQTQISNSVRPVNQNRFYEFTTADDSSLTIKNASGYSTEHGTVAIFDSLAPNPIGLKIVQDSYIYHDEPYTDFLIIKYTITNQNSTPLHNLFAGIFIDWDINETAVDFARFLADQNLGWVQNTLDAPTVLSGTMLLNPEVGFGFRAINNNEINDAFTDLEKWTMLSSGVQTESLNNMDVSTLLSAGPLDFAAGESKEVAFALVAGESLIDLRINAAAAKSLWENNLIPASDKRAPLTTTSIFLNPVNSKYANITVISDKSLLEPPLVKLISHTDTLQIAMTPISKTKTEFAGNHEFGTTGIHQLETSVKPRFGSDTTATREFTLAAFSPGKSTTITSLDSDLLFIPAAGLEHESYILSEVFTEKDQRVLSFQPRLVLQEKALLTVQIDPGKFPQTAKVVILQEAGSGWKKLPTEIDRENSSAAAAVTQLGKFMLGVDTAADVAEKFPDSFILEQNYPNPFNPQTRIGYSLPKTTAVSIIIYNAIGQRVSTLINQTQTAGRYIVQWDGTNERGQHVPSGLFFYQLKTPGTKLVRKMLLLR